MTPGVDFANSSVQYDNYTTDAGSCTTYVGNKTTEAANETGGGTEQLQGTINFGPLQGCYSQLSQNYISIDQQYKINAFH